MTSLGRGFWFSRRSSCRLPMMLGVLNPAKVRQHYCRETAAKSSTSLLVVQQQLSVSQANLISETQICRHPTVQQAFVAVQKIAEPGDIILVYGSFYTVAEVGAEPV